MSITGCTARCFRTFLLSILLSLGCFFAWPAAAEAPPADADSIRVALFADPHFTEGARRNTTPRMPQLARDANNRIPSIDFAMGMGDEVHDHAGWIGVWKRKLVRHLNLPYHFTPGDHDVVDYYWKEKPRSAFPYKMLKGMMRESELTTPTYAMLRSNILFLIIGDKGPILKIHESQKRWVEQMVRQYPEKTTILVSHAPVRGTTKASNRHDWGWRHSEMWWWRLFKENPQIRAYIHGDGHALSYYVGSNNNQRGYEGTNGDWGHDIAFIEPGGHSLLRDRHNRNQFIVLDINENSLTTRAWRNEEEGQWVDVYDHNRDVPGGTSYNPSARNWYSFPLFFQDGETQVLGNDLVPFGPVEIQLTGIERYSLFNNPEIVAGHTSNEKVSGFENGVVNEYRREADEMVIDGASELKFPDKHANREKGGKSGQIKHYLQHGSTPQIVPGARYAVTIRARSKSGDGRLAVRMSTSEWKNRTQYSRLEGSERQVIEGSVGKEFSTLRGTYTAPEDENGWFLQGAIDFRDETEYFVDAFRIHRRTDEQYTRDARVKLNGKWYDASGTLKPGDLKLDDVKSSAITNDAGRMRFKARAGGNRQIMARMIFHSPVLVARNGRFRIDGVNEGTAEITLLDGASRFSDRFKLFPYTNGPGVFTVEPGVISRSNSGHRHAELPIAEDRQKVTIEFQPDK